MHRGREYAGNRAMFPNVVSEALQFRPVARKE